MFLFIIDYFIVRLIFTGSRVVCGYWMSFLFDIFIYLLLVIVALPLTIRTVYSTLSERNNVQLHIYAVQRSPRTCNHVVVAS